MYDGSHILIPSALLLRNGGWSQWEWAQQWNLQSSCTIWGIICEFNFIYIYIYIHIYIYTYIYIYIFIIYANYSEWFPRFSQVTIRRKTKLVMKNWVDSIYWMPPSFTNDFKGWVLIHPCYSETATVKFGLIDAACGQLSSCHVKACHYNYTYGYVISTYDVYNMYMYYMYI